LKRVFTATDSVFSCRYLGTIHAQSDTLWPKWFDSSSHQ